MRRAVLACAVAALSLATVAFASSVPDRDDVATGMDIARASSTHNRATDRLVEQIDAYDAFAPAALLNRGRPPSSVCFEIWTTNAPAQRPPNYEACATPAANGRRWKAALSRTRRKGPPLRVATLRVEQPRATRLVMRIDPDSIRRPASYRWRAQTTSFAADCKLPSGCPDYAPDRPATVVTKLGKPRR